jgi:hypothetical protein
MKPGSSELICYMPAMCLPIFILGSFSCSFNVGDSPQFGYEGLVFPLESEAAIIHNSYGNKSNQALPALFQ